MRQESTEPTGEWHNGTNGTNGAPGMTGQDAKVARLRSLTLSTSTRTDIPGLTLDINVPSATSALILSTDGGVSSSPATANEGVLVEISLFVDGAADPVVKRRLNVVTFRFAGLANWAMSIALNGLSVGNHTVKVTAQLINVTVAGQTALVSNGPTSPPSVQRGIHCNAIGVIPQSPTRVRPLRFFYRSRRSPTTAHDPDTTSRCAALGSAEREQFWPRTLGTAITHALASASAR